MATVSEVRQVHMSVLSFVPSLLQIISDKGKFKLDCLNNIEAARSRFDLKRAGNLRELELHKQSQGGL